MVKILEEFPQVHATFNLVPLLGEQIEEYASGRFKEPWFEIAFAPAESLSADQKREALERAFQVNENLMRRWPRFGELESQTRSGGTEACVAHWSPREWRDLQVLSQLAWMDEEYLAKDPVIRALSDKERNFTEEDKSVLMEKQHELLGAVLPEYRLAAARGQIEISTTPYYHPILPLLCDSDIARVANPHTPLPSASFSLPGGCARAAREGAAISRALLRKTSRGTLAIGGLGFRPGARNRRRSWISMVCDGRRRARADAEYRILARRFRIPGEWPGIIHAVAIQRGASGR